jgi:TrbC/VIRB2 pilin
MILSIAIAGGMTMMKKGDSMLHRVTLMLVVVLALTLRDTAYAQAMQPVVDSINMVAATLAAISLGVLISAWTVAGYKMSFAGVGFRDVSGLLLGGAISGGAAVIAAMFI